MYRDEVGDKGTWLHNARGLVGVVLQKEIEKVKKRREEREIERAQQEEELSMLARERAIAEGYEMEKKEEEVRNLLADFCMAYCFSWHLT